YNKVINSLNFTYDEVNNTIKRFIVKNKKDYNIYSISLSEYLQDIYNSTELSPLTIERILQYVIIR
ncbi:hypothetical protein, partial [Clostridium argentinense]